MGRKRKIFPGATAPGPPSFFRHHTNTPTSYATVRGRRKSSQKLAKRRTFVWGGGGGGGGLDRFRKASFKKKKKKKLHVDYVRSAPLGPAANRLEVDRAAQGPTLRKGGANKSIECVQRKAGSGGVLRSVDDTCHDSRSTQNRKLAFLVLRTSGTTPSRQPHQSGRSHHCCRRSFRPVDVRLVVQRLRCYEQCRAVGDTARFVQWGSNLFLHVGPGSWRGATANQRRALHPLFMTALETLKISTLLLDVKHTRTKYDSLTTQGSYER